MRKEWWYVIALVVILLILMIVFREEVGLGPEKDDDKNLDNNFLGLDDNLDNGEQKIAGIFKNAVRGARK